MMFACDSGAWAETVQLVAFFIAGAYICGKLFDR